MIKRHTGPLRWYTNACCGTHSKAETLSLLQYFTYSAIFSAAIIIVAPAGSAVTAITKTCAVSFSSFLLTSIFLFFAIKSIITSAVIVTATPAVIITAAPKTAHIYTSFIILYFIIWDQ